MNEDLNPKNLKEGEDYYLTPEGYRCFTEKYHLKRGYCCKSGCRHCPYGFDKKTGTIKKWSVFTRSVQSQCSVTVYSKKIQHTTNNKL